MKSSEIRETLINYIENKILFDKLNGSCNIISSNGKHDIYYTDNSIGTRNHISVSNSELLKYYRFLKHK